MANNRIFLVNDRLGIHVSIAKFGPGGWWASDKVGQVMNDALEQDADYSMYGRTGWRIEFETVTDSNGDPDTDLDYSRGQIHVVC
jgi:hypothetical protein